jgi:hypothetical protein
MIITDQRILYLYNKVLFPNCTMEVKTVEIGGRMMARDDMLIVVPVKNMMDFIFAGRRYAVLASVVHIREAAGSRVAEIRGLRRGKIIKRRKIYFGDFSPHDLISGEHLQKSGIALRKKSQEFVFLMDIPESERLIYLINFISDPVELSDFIAHYFIVDFKKRLQLFEAKSAEKRLVILLKFLDEMIAKVKKEKGAL